MKSFKKEVPSKNQLVTLVACAAVAQLPVGNKNPKNLVRLLHRMILQLPLDLQYRGLADEAIQYLANLRPSGSRTKSGRRPLAVGSVKGKGKSVDLAQFVLLNEPSIPKMDSTGLVIIS